LEEVSESAREDPKNAISDDLETPNFQKHLQASYAPGVGNLNLWFNFARNNESVI
jgi:hypothetical protein